jgi:hypothetical protein
MKKANKQLPTGWMLLHCHADLPLDPGDPQGEVDPVLVNHLRSAERIINDTQTDYDDHPMVSLRLEGQADAFFPAAVARVCTKAALAC